MGCGSSSEFSDDEPRTVVVFGATGLLGGAVARALHTDPLHFRVRAVTRRPSSEKARKLAEEGMTYELSISIKDLEFLFKCDDELKT